jgi:cupin fold WbuC family metalloprotein
MTDKSIFQIIDDKLLHKLTEEAKAKPRLRINYNFHTNLNDKCQRLLNAMQPGTQIPIHHHNVAEMYIILKGKLKTNLYNDNGEIIESIILDPKNNQWGVQIPAKTWHTLEVLQNDTVIFEVKEGPYIPHEISGILTIEKNTLC